MSDSRHLPPQRVSDAYAAAPAAGDEAAAHPAISETRAFLALASVRGVGQKTLFALAEAGRRFGDVLEYGPDAAPGAEGPRLATEPPVSKRRWSAIRNHALAQGDELAALLERLGVALIFRGDPRFPDSLRDLERPPHWLFVQGAIALLKQPSIAIVGTRKPSADGLFLARYVGACLGDWRRPTVSGLAAGIDQLAHEHSLRAGVPTIAVLGTGILDDYPKGSDLLRNRILADGGSIVTEYLPRISYSAENFVQRNRLQAALGRLLVPVEWGRRSGTAHTLRFATQLMRPIAGLTLPEWPIDRVQFEPGLGLEAGRIFTVPRDQLRFDRFVRAALGESAAMPVEQLSFLEPD